MLVPPFPSPGMTSVRPYIWLYTMLTTKPRAHMSWVSLLPAELRPSPKAPQRQTSSHLQAGDTKTSLVDICVFWVFTGAFAIQEDWQHPQRERSGTEFHPAHGTGCLLSPYQEGFQDQVLCGFLTLSPVCSHKHFVPQADNKEELVTSWSVRKCGKEHVT